MLLNKNNLEVFDTLANQMACAVLEDEHILTLSPKAYIGTFCTSDTFLNECRTKAQEIARKRKEHNDKTRTQVNNSGSNVSGVYGEVEGLIGELIAEQALKEIGCLDNFDMVPAFSADKSQYKRADFIHKKSKKRIDVRYCRYNANFKERFFLVSKASKKEFDSNLVVFQDSENPDSFHLLLVSQDEFNANKQTRKFTTGDHFVYLINPEEFEVVI